MVALSSWCRYFVSKLEYSVLVAQNAHAQRQIADNEVLNKIFRDLVKGRLTFLHWNKGEEMGSDMIGTLLVRKIPLVDPMRVHVNDVVILRDPSPTKFGNYLVRRLAAIEGDEMISTDEEDEPFVIAKDHCWVLGANDKLQPRELYDSRTFGPVRTENIVGRAIYCLRNALNHGPITNCKISESQDLPILEVELDIDEMVKNHKE